MFQLVTVSTTRNGAAFAWRSAKEKLSRRKRQRKWRNYTDAEKSAEDSVKCEGTHKAEKKKKTGLELSNWTEKKITHRFTAEKAKLRFD